MWCVITEVPKDAKGEDDNGNLYDCILTGQDIESAYARGQTSNKSADITELLQRKVGIMSHKVANFYMGEIIPVATDFEREVCGRGRKPNKWDVEYELFPARNYKLALARAIKATKEGAEPWDNLKYLAQQHRRNQRYNVG